MSNILKKFPNLKIISRDRGVQYRSLSGPYQHIADRFHLLTNLTETMITELKKNIPREIKISIDGFSKYEETKNNTIEFSNNSFTIKYKEKLNLILEIKEKSLKGFSTRKLATEYNLDRKTIKKYIDMVNPNIDSIYDASNRKNSYLDPFKFEISELCNNLPASKIKLYLEEKYNRDFSLNTINYFIRKHRLRFKDRNVEKIKSKQNFIKLYRSRLIKYIFGWKINNEDKNIIEQYFNNICDKYIILKEYKEFYYNFKKALVNRDVEEIIDIIKSNYKNKVIDKYVRGLNNDFQAVINATKYKYSNGCVEGNINKLKKIKRDMYGRAHIQLLKNKVIYQSLYF